ncbi:MAG: DUF4393 domain-containing protein [Burkholderiaceae bacterium]|nr:DUF4393 domain-containing protein [Burkholderiaceae bacterium]
MTSSGGSSGGRALAEVAARAADFMGDTVGELVKDGVHYLRWKLAGAILDRASDILKERNAKKRKTPPVAMAIRFMDAASLEDDPNIQELWARLLANAADPTRDYALNKTHIAILSEMNALDAEILLYIADQKWGMFRDIAEGTGISPTDRNGVAGALQADPTAVGIALGNLWRLGCLLQEPTVTSGIGPSVAPRSSFRPSPLGFSLLQATRSP